VRHFVLSASKATLLKRLRKRFDGKNSWPARQIDRCLHAFAQDIAAEVVDTENKSISTVAEEVARRAGPALPPDTRSAARKWFDRVRTQIGQIR